MGEQPEGELPVMMASWEEEVCWVEFWRRGRWLYTVTAYIGFPPRGAFPAHSHRDAGGTWMVLSGSGKKWSFY